MILEYLINIIDFFFDNLFLIFMIYIWAKTSSKQDLSDQEMRFDLRMKRMSDMQQNLLERVARVEEKTGI